MSLSEGRANPLTAHFLARIRGLMGWAVSGSLEGFGLAIID